GYQPRGKQVRKPEGIWYTPSTGIWQTVWLEPVNSIRRIESIKIVPDAGTSSVKITVNMSGVRDQAATRIEVYDGQTRIAYSWQLLAFPDTPTFKLIHQTKLWSPESPYLYRVRIGLNAKEPSEPDSDVVESYFALRTIEVGKDDHGTPRILL